MGGAPDRSLPVRAAVPGTAPAAVLYHRSHPPKPDGFPVLGPGNASRMSTQLEPDPQTTYDRAELADVTVLVEDGVAVLRGIVESPARQLELERRALSIDGVEQVENLVQLPAA